MPFPSAVSACWLQKELLTNASPPDWVIFIFCIPSAQTKGVRAGFAMKQISEGNSHALSGQFDPQLLKRPGGEHDFIRCVRIVAMDLSNSRRDMPLPFRLIVG